MDKKSEKRICQNCKKNFTIEPDDFLFYEKIKVPPPTFCPECRFLRRFATMNDRIFYKRTCDLTKKEIFSIFPEGTTFPVYETDAWYSDKWDPYQYGMDYDFSRLFFEQFKELENKVPHLALTKQGMSVNSPYTHRVHDMKNCYMICRATKCEDSFYSYTVEYITDSSDCIWTDRSELCYECITCKNCYNTRFSQDSNNCRDSSFLYACRNCSNCVGCVNLVNKQFYIWNQPFTKEEYFEKIKELRLNTFSGLTEIEKEFNEFRKKFPQKAIVSIKSNDVSGNWFSNCKNVHNSFDCVNVKDGKYLFSVFDAQDCMDYFEWGDKSELIYESANCGINSSRLSFCLQCWMGAHDLLYCDSCPSSRYCFGCIGLKKGEYSILNKRYTKEEYDALIPKIIEHMKEMPYVDNRGMEYKFGEHFPGSLFSFAYNETIAYDFFPMTEEEVVKKGYTWKERKRKNYKTTIDSSSLPETIGEVDDTILDEIINCAEKDSQYSVGAYRITSGELAFYRRMDLPLPRVCFDVRHMRRVAKRPPFKIIKRNCEKCNIEVETVYNESYAPIIYCEKCYQQEVY
ncbi:MAG: hypothetical protein NTZ87_02375 [Candidatus Nomurabacteria bacterium]|nr:hypothetical protein [Candidatus Nomurabacteria bacterium]